MRLSESTARRRRLLAVALGIAVLAIAADRLVFRMESRAYWLRALPAPALHGLTALGDPAAFYAMGERQRLQGEYLKAQQSLARAMERAPGFLSARGEYANVLIDVGSLVDAYAISRECLSQDPRIVPALVASGRLYGMRHNWQKAESHVREVLAIDPNRPEAWLLQAQIHQAKGEWSQAITAARRAVAAQPHVWQGWTVLSTATREQGDASESLRHAERAVKLAPRMGETHRCLGLALLGSADPGAPARAEAALREAVRIDPEDAESQVGIGQALVRQRRWQPATTHLKMVLRRWPLVNDSRSLLAEAAGAIGQPDQARHWRAEHARWEGFLSEQRALIADTSNQHYSHPRHLALARLYARMGLWEEGFKEAEMALRWGPDPDGLALLKTFEQKTGRRSKFSVARRS
jgi:tetratricopeptide (TPR) repeat protein